MGENEDNNGASSIVNKFLEHATVVQLRQKLNLLGLKSSGNKAELKLTITKAIPNMSVDQLDYFSEISKGSNLTGKRLDDDDDVDENDDDDNDHHDNEDDSEEILDEQLEDLKRKYEKKLKIQELRLKIAELEHETSTNLVGAVAPNMCFNFRDVEESLVQFSGDNNHTIGKWINQFEEVANNFGWNSKTKFVYAKRLMTGTAKLFLRSASATTWPQLKTCLSDEFYHKTTTAELHEELRHRKKKTNETYQQYALSMQEIASLGNIEEEEVIQYIIYGINDNNANKAMLYSAKNMKEFKMILRKYEKLKSNHGNTVGNYKCKT